MADPFIEAAMKARERQGVQRSNSGSANLPSAVTRQPLQFECGANYSPRPFRSATGSSRPMSDCPPPLPPRPTTQQLLTQTWQSGNGTHVETPLNAVRSSSFLQVPNLNGQHSIQKSSDSGFSSTGSLQNRQQLQEINYVPNKLPKLQLPPLVMPRQQTTVLGQLSPLASRPPGRVHSNGPLVPPRPMSSSFNGVEPVVKVNNKNNESQQRERVLSVRLPPAPPPPLPQLPPPMLSPNNSGRGSYADAMSLSNDDFESRFRFPEMRQLPVPPKFVGGPRTYPSTMANMRYVSSMMQPTSLPTVGTRGK